MSICLTLLCLQRPSYNVSGKFVEGSFLVNHPYFWTTKERYTFIKNLQDAIKTDLVDKDDLNRILAARNTYGNRSNIIWPSKIDKSAIYKEIIDKGKTDRVAINTKLHSTFIASLWLHCITLSVFPLSIISLYIAALSIFEGQIILDLFP